MSEIKVPVSAPGAQEAAMSMDMFAKSVEKLTDREKGLLEQEKRNAAVRKSVDAQIIRRAEHYNTINYRAKQYALTSSKAIDLMEREKRALADAGGGLSNRAQRKLLSMIPGGGMLDDIGDVAGGSKGGGRLAAGFGVLTVALMAGAAVFRANALSVERATQATLDRMKVDNDIARQAKAAFDEQQKTAAKDFGSIRNAARFIVGTQGRQGERDVQDLMSRGGPEAVNAMADLIRDRGRALKGRTASGILQDVAGLQETTGADMVTILKALSSQEGAYRPERIGKDLMGGLTPEMFKYFSETGMGAGLGGLIERFDEVQGQSRKASAGRALNAGLVLGGAMTELENLVDPMKKVVDAHNAKIAEEIAMRDAVIYSQQSYIDFWKDNLGPLTDLMRSVGIESAQTKARRESRVLSGNKR